MILKLFRLPNSKLEALSIGLKGDLSTFAVVLDDMFGEIISSDSFEACKKDAGPPQLFRLAAPPEGELGADRLAGEVPF